MNSLPQRSLSLGLLGLAIFVVFWGATTLGNKPSDLSGPWLVVLALRELALSGELVKNVVASVFRVGTGFALATAIGIPLGVLCGWYLNLRLSFNPMVQIMRPISPIAWLPIATLMFGGVTFAGLGASDLSAVFLIFLASFFPIITATTSAVRSIEQKFLRSAANFGVEGMEFYRRVLLPAALPQILTGLRLALGIAWVVVVAAEMLGVENGLGYQVLDARNALRYDRVLAAMVVIGFIGLCLDVAMSRLEHATLARRGRSTP